MRRIDVMKSSVLAAFFAVLMAGCSGPAQTADTPAAGDVSPSGVEAPRIELELVVWGVDAEAGRRSTALRWARSRTDDRERGSDARGTDRAGLLDEARSQLRASTGRVIYTEPSVVARSGTRAQLEYSGGSGSVMRVTAKPTVLESGEIAVDLGVRLEQTGFSERGQWDRIRFARPAVAFGSRPLTLRSGESYGVRLDKEVGTVESPEKLEVFAFVRARLVG